MPLTYVVKYSLLIALEYPLSVGIASIFHQSTAKVPQSKPTNYSIYSKSVLPEVIKYIPERQSQSDRQNTEWNGRLILPNLSQSQPTDYAFLEIRSAPSQHSNLVGKTVKLRWNYSLEFNDIVKDIKFDRATLESQTSGNLHPQRLENRGRINPLLSLAGARTNDDVFVKLQKPVSLLKDKNDYFLNIASEPIQITGDRYALVTILKRHSETQKDKFIIRHFDSKSRKFIGNSETIEIPQSIPDRDGIYRFTNRDLEKSWYNDSGWYIYGNRDKDGVFVARAIAPRKIFLLEADTIRLGKVSTNSYLNGQMWAGTSLKKGTAQVILVDPQASSKRQAKNKWKEGDRALVMHIYGGIGGKKAEPTTYGIVTGHFAYGIATIFREPIGDRLNFDITYHQIYAHNPDGIIAGKIAASSYLGDIQRGWLGNRPIADVIIKFAPVTEDYNFGGIKLSPLDEFSEELQKMMARYRIGDGTGSATVTPVTSCVQDANQALYITIKKIDRKVRDNPQIQAWLKAHPNSPQTLRLNQLVKLGEDLEKNLVPLGIVRPDWQQSTGQLAGIKRPDNFLDTISKGVLSWRTIIPRRAHDEIATIFLNNGASAWIVKTNQLGGFDPDILPLAPTALFGHNTN